nr:MAG TPA: hypothetical protein [Caudoviricetes sp.]
MFIEILILGCTLKSKRLCKIKLVCIQGYSVSQDNLKFLI